MAILTPLIRSGETIATRRLRLRPIVLDDLAAPWVTAAITPDWQVDEVSRHLDLAMAADDEAGGLVGLAVALPGEPAADAVTIALVTVDPARRYAGLGAEFVIALEGLASERWQVENAFAPVPAGRGLAVYFWLRLGYRPLTLAESPGPVTGLNAEPREGIWMSRRLQVEG